MSKISLKRMYPNFPNMSDFDTEFINHPQFKLFLQRKGNITLHDSGPSHESFHGNNSQQFDSLEETLPNTPQHPHDPTTMNPNPILATPTRCWSIVEDEALILAYMEHCRDALNNTDQKAADLWRKVSASYNEAQAKKPHVLSPRSVKMLENRWRRISPDITLWDSCYEEAMKIMGSECNKDDVIVNAHKIFRSSVKPKSRNFTCEHGWRMVIRDPRWRRLVRWGISKEERRACKESEDELIASSVGSSKRTRNDVEDLTTEETTSFTKGGTHRPSGVNKAKTIRKSKGIAIDGNLGEFTDEFRSSSAIRMKAVNMRRDENEVRLKEVIVRQEELQVERRKHKFGILQILLVKQSLTPNEEATKEKLMNEICSSDY